MPPPFAILPCPYLIAIVTVYTPPLPLAIPLLPRTTTIVIRQDIHISQTYITHLIIPLLIDTPLPYLPCWPSTHTVVVPLLPTDWTLVLLHIIPLLLAIGLQPGQRRTVEGRTYAANLLWLLSSNVSCVLFIHVSMLIMSSLSDILSSDLRERKRGRN